MKNDELQMLVRCYENSREPVLLLDENWQVLWSNRNPGVGYLPEMLGIPEESWESCVKEFRLCDDRYVCSLVCNRQDGVRIAVLHQPDAGVIPVDTGVISNALSSVNAACSELHRKRPEDAELLDAIAGNCYKIYRTTYLQRELDRRQAGFWQKTCFSVRAALVDLGAHIEGVLGDTTDLEMHICEAQICLEADKDAFVIAMLSAVVLCYCEPEKRQALDIVLEQAEDKLILTVSMEPTPEDRDDHRKRLGDFGTTEGEQIFLDTFCKEYNGKWMLFHTEQLTSCRIELPAAELSDSLTIGTGMERREGRFFNKYEVLLARICFRGFY